MKTNWLEIATTALAATATLALIASSANAQVVTEQDHQYLSDLRNDFHMKSNVMTQAISDAQKISDGKGVCQDLRQGKTFRHLEQAAQQYGQRNYRSQSKQIDYSNYHTAVVTQSIDNYCPEFTRAWQSYGND